MGVTYSASAVLGIKLTEDLVLGKYRGHTSKCGHDPTGDEAFCGKCGSRVQMVEVYGVNPPFSQWQESWSGDFSDLIAKHEHRSLGSLQVFNLDPSLDRDQGGPFVLGKAVWEARDLNDGGHKEMNPVDLLQQRNDLIAQFERMELAEVDVRLWLFGGCR